MICEWCGHEHGVDVLCSKRPKWSRRGFLSLMGAAAIGAITPIKSEPISYIIYGTMASGFVIPKGYFKPGKTVTLSGTWN